LTLPERRPYLERVRIILKTVAVATVTLTVAAAVPACSTSGSGAADGRFRVVVAETFWGSIVEQLAGRDADVTSIIASPDADPHDYEPTAKDARTFATAQYVVVNGIGYDAWAQKLLDANPVKDRKVLNIGDLLGLEAGSNPHQWYSPASVRRVVTRVSADMANLDSDHRDGYARRRRAYESTGLGEYNRLLAEISRRFAGAPIGATESIVAPWAAGAGLDLVTPEKFIDAIAEGNEPTRSDKATVDEQIADRKIEVLVYNSQNATPDVQRLVDAARREHIPVTTITETLVPEHSTFQAWQVRELRALLDALAGSSPS
jgi:zinc/manganese transport system substrate-binding protein